MIDVLFKHWIEKSQVFPQEETIENVLHIYAASVRIGYVIEILNNSEFHDAHNYLTSSENGTSCDVWFILHSSIIRKTIAPQQSTK